VLDELEAALDAETEERTQCGVALPMTEQFVRVANTMSQWKGERSRSGHLVERPVRRLHFVAER
jgi:hypothetical protein